MSIPENAFGIGAVGLNFMDRRGSPYAADAASGEGVGQGGGGLVRLHLVQLLPEEFGGGMVKWLRTDARLGGMAARAYEGVRVVGLDGTADALGGWVEVLQGHRALVLFGWVHHHGVGVLLRKRLLVSVH